MRSLLRAVILLLPLVALLSASAHAVCNGTPTANTDVYNIAKNTTVNIYHNDLKANDTDPESDALSAYISGYPTAGGWCGIGPDGVCYQPPTGFTGLVSIPYAVTDNCTSDGGTVLVFVQ